MDSITADIIIIGAGAAGLTAAQYAARANLSVLVIESSASGGQALLIDNLENYPGVADPCSGFTLSVAMKQQAETFGASFITTTVSSIEKNDVIFYVSTTEKRYTAKAVILATGAEHRHLQIPGEAEFSGKGVSWCATCDGPFFKGRRILVVGGGDSACDEAMFLSKLSSNITMVHRKDRFRAQKSIARRILANDTITVCFNTVVTEIKGDDFVTGVTLQDTITGETMEHATDAVFIFAGMLPRTALVPFVKKDSAGYISTDARMETSLAGLFCAGDVRSKPFRQIVTAAADGATAAYCAAQYIDSLKGNLYR